MNRPPTLGLRHLALNVQNLAVMREFYVDVLGFEVEWEPDPLNVYLTSGQDNLALHQVSGAISGGSLDHLGILVRQPSEVDAWAAYLQDRGIALAMQPKTHRDGARSIYFRDPENNIIQLIYHPPISNRL